MVMAQTQSPNTNTQYVAHEFVRQYYTILHKDPTQLHRFYTKESRLTHGVSPNAKSEEQPVCGQEAIYEKIGQLNFKNCCAKIRSVDSHPTLAGGVVIQVNGELANSGLSYRKFMQTFVLAQQEPKKYHVLNDIFRYQDETFEDTENDETIDGTIESENGYQYEGLPTNQNQSEDAVNEQDSKPLVNDTPVDYGYPAYIENEQDTKQMNGGMLDNEPDITETEPEPQVNDVEPETPIEEVPQEPVQTEEQETSEITEVATDDKNNMEQTEEQAAPVEPEQPAKPFTWAALAKKNTASTTAAPQPKPAPKKPTPAPQKIAPKKREDAPPAPKKETEEPRRRTPAPDTHQIFIGNLPNSITEKDVRDNFGEYGNIIEVRLNAKNFGFIAFDGPDPPTKILSLSKNKTFVINGNNINIEVKRSGATGRDRGGDRGGFRRGGSDKERRGESGRSDFNKNSKNNGQFNNNNRSGGKNAFNGQKPRDDVKSGENKGQKEQSKTRDQTKQGRR